MKVIKGIFVFLIIYIILGVIGSIMIKLGIIESVEQETTKEKTEVSREASYYNHFEYGFEKVHKGGHGSYYLFDTHSMQCYIFFKDSDNVYIQDFKGNFNDGLYVVNEDGEFGAYYSRNVEGKEYDSDKVYLVGTDGKVICSEKLLSGTKIDSIIHKYDSKMRDNPNIIQYKRNSNN